MQMQRKIPPMTVGNGSTHGFIAAFLGKHSKTKLS